MKNITRIVALVMVLCVLAACSPAKEEKQEVAVAELPKKACLISDEPLSSDFLIMTCNGFKLLEKDGWEVKTIECLEAAEYADQIRAMAAEGYTAIFTLFDNINQAAMDLADEIHSAYPDTHVFLMDTYVQQDFPGYTTVSVDPFESSFVAGFVAAKVTQKKQIGWIGWDETIKISQFLHGYEAGAKYAGTGVEIVTAATGDSMDPMKGYETGIAMIENYDIDIIYHSAYISGNGVIEACAEKGVQCIGCDVWQGDIDDCVIWSALKPMDLAIYTLATEWQSGMDMPNYINLGLGNGGSAYDDRDLENLSDELRTEVLQLKDDIASGKVDIYAGFDEFRIEN